MTAGLAPNLLRRRLGRGPPDQSVRIEVGAAGEMRVWAPHAVFAAMLMGSLAAHERAPDPYFDSESLEPAVLRVAQSHGWEFVGYKGNNVTNIVADEPTLVFQAPGCSKPVLVSLRLATFEDRVYYAIRRSTRLRAPLYLLWADLGHARPSGSLRSAD